MEIKTKIGRGDNFFVIQDSSIRQYTCKEISIKVIDSGLGTDEIEIIYKGSYRTQSCEVNEKDIFISVDELCENIKLLELSDKLR